MPETTSIGPNTTQAEYDAILAHYGNDSAAIAQAIENQDATFEQEDLIAAFLQMEQSVPTSWLLLGPGDDSLDYIWDDIESQETLLSWQTSHPGSVAAQQITDFMAVIGVGSGNILEETQDLIDQLSNLTGEGELQEEGFLNLFNNGDIQQVMGAFFQINPGLGLLFYLAFVYKESKDELQDAALGLIEDAEFEREVVLDDILDVSSTDEDAQSQTTALNQQMQVINSVIQTMIEFIQNAEEAFNSFIQTAGNMSDAFWNTNNAMSQNI